MGEIWDEHDEVVEQFRRQDDGSYLIDGSADVDRMLDLFSLKEESDSATVSGWVLDKLGHIPETGERFACDGLAVTVTRVQHHRVLEIQVRPLPAAEPVPTGE